MQQISRKEIFVFIVCAGLATTFWFFNRLDNNFTTLIKYPVTFIYNPAEITFTKPLPTYLKLNVSGYGWRILEKMYYYQRKPLMIAEPFFANKNFILSKNILPYVNETLSDIKINTILPDTIPCYYEKRSVKKLPIRLDTSFKMKPGYRIVGNIELNPDTIIIYGASSLVSSLDEIFSETIEIKEPESDINRDIKLKIQEHTGLFYSHRSTNMSIKIKPFDSETLIVDLIKYNFPEQFSKDTINSYQTKLSFLKQKERPTPASGSFKLVLDYRLYNAETKNIPVQIEKFPEDVQKIKLLQPFYIFE